MCLALITNGENDDERQAPAHPEGVHGSRGSGSGRAVYDDPRVAVGAGRFDEVGARAEA